MATAVDFFCGMGGSSTGLVGAGFEVKVAANHWTRAIETHSANHPDTEHLCADISAIDLRYLPRTDILWASPICTEVSPAGGTRKRRAQHDLFEDYGHVPTEAFERTRVTFWEVIRAAEIFRYPIVLIENVVESAQWELFDTWLAGMATLGYSHQCVSVSAAHVGGEDNPHAPQWRDRLYIVFNRHDVPAPNVDPRPLAWCEQCGHDVRAQQWWKRPGRRIGKYGPQYIYVCHEGNHGPVEPYVAPAAAAIDWTDLGTRIGDRDKALAPKTMARIRKGLEMFGPSIVGAAGNTYDSASTGRGDYYRAWPAHGSPIPAQTTDAQHGLVSPPFAFSTAHGGRSEPVAVDARPMPMRTAQTEALEIPGSFVSMLRNHGRNHAVGEPAQTFTGGGYHHGLVIPFRRGSKPYPAKDGPLSTMATRDQHGVLHPAIDVADCHFRMLKPREAANAQAFPRQYVIHGNSGEQQMQAGNAVPVNVAHWLGSAALIALGERAA